SLPECERPHADNPCRLRVPDAVHPVRSAGGRNRGLAASLGWTRTLRRRGGAHLAIERLLARDQLGAGGLRSAAQGGLLACAPCPCAACARYGEDRAWCGDLGR